MDGWGWETEAAGDLPPLPPEVSKVFKTGLLGPDLVWEILGYFVDPIMLSSILVDWVG